MDQHTPTPWTATQAGLKIQIANLKEWARYGVITLLDIAHAPDKTIREADAAFIVTACNSFDEREALLRRAAEKLQDYIGETDGERNDPLAMEIFKALGE